MYTRDMKYNSFGSKTYNKWLENKPRCQACNKEIEYDRRFKKTCDRICGNKIPGRKKKKANIWTSDRIEKLKELYPITENWDDLLKEFPFATKGSIKGATRFLDLKKPRVRNYPIKVDENIFSEWNERSAYLLGYLEADGYFIPQKTKTIKSIHITFCCSTKDNEFLDLLAKIINFTGKIKQNNHNLSNGKTYTSKRFEVFSRQWAKDLENKYRIKKIPDCIIEDLLPHYIRGLWDGDGSWYIEKCTGQTRCNLVASSINLLESVATHIRPITQSKLTIYKKTSSDHCWYINMAQNATIRLAKFLYKDANFYMERKFNKIKNFL
jgi:hypothetical protein